MLEVVAVLVVVALVRWELRALAVPGPYKKVTPVVPVRIVLNLTAVAAVAVPVRSVR
jgi:hypothetical protein